MPRWSDDQVATWRVARKNFGKAEDTVGCSVSEELLGIKKVLLEPSQNTVYGTNGTEV